MAQNEVLLGASRNAKVIWQNSQVRVQVLSAGVYVDAIKSTATAVTILPLTFVGNPIALTWNNASVDYLTVSGGTDAGDTGNTSLDIQNKKSKNGSNAGRTGLDLLPTSGTIPTAGALAELVLYRTTDKTVNFERLNFSAMAATQYRIGMEKGGTGVLRDIVWAHEQGVTAGKEIYLTYSASLVGDSTPIALSYSHLRFDTDSQGGLGTTVYIARGGGSGLNYNVPTSSSHVLLVNNVAVGTFDAVGLTLAASGKVAPTSGVAGYAVVSTGYTLGSAGTAVLPTADMGNAANDAARDTLAGNIAGAFATDNTGVAGTYKAWFRVGTVWKSVIIT